MFFQLAHMSPSEIDEKVKIVSQRVFNGYPKEYSNFVHHHYNKGDFVVAFSGCKVYQDQEECNRLFSRYGEMAESRCSAGNK